MSAIHPTIFKMLSDSVFVWLYSVDISHVFLKYLFPSFIKQILKELLKELTVTNMLNPICAL